MKKNFSVKEMAALLSVNEETIRRWIRENKIDAEYIGGSVGYRISKEAMKKCITSNSRLKSTLSSKALAMIGIAPTLYNDIFQEATWLQNVLTPSNNTHCYSKSQTHVGLIKTELEFKKKAAELTGKIAHLQSELDIINSELNAMAELRLLSKEENNNGK